MEQTTLVITSIASDDHPVLRKIAAGSKEHHMNFILIGDTKSPSDFSLDGCDFYSVDRQQEIDPEFASLLPTRHYARKNLGYLRAMQEGADVIIETDDDNIPIDGFWEHRHLQHEAPRVSKEKGWVSIYRYFTSRHVWPRGLPPDEILAELPGLTESLPGSFPIQQGLAKGNPDVDAIFRMVQPGDDICFNDALIAHGQRVWCPFNSQNTTWFREAFPLMYLPSYCSFRMTDIWRSFVAQRIARTCGWDILFHGPTVFQERNAHDLMKDFSDEVPGYLYNEKITRSLDALELPEGTEHIRDNLVRCYETLTGQGMVREEEMELVKMWVGLV